jgi:hypothetical protein
MPGAHHSFKQTIWQPRSGEIAVRSSKNYGAKRRRACSCCMDSWQQNQRGNTGRHSTDRYCFSGFCVAMAPIGGPTVFELSRLRKTIGYAVHACVVIETFIAKSSGAIQYNLETIFEGTPCNRYYREITRRHVPAVPYKAAGSPVPPACRRWICHPRLRWGAPR